MNPRVSGLGPRRRDVIPRSDENGTGCGLTNPHEARVKVEKLGLKTYTQVVNGDGGKRIRVRVGPFPDKDAAEKAAGKIRQAGMTAAILAL